MLVVANLREQNCGLSTAFSRSKSVLLYVLAQTLRLQTEREGGISTHRSMHHFLIAVLQEIPPHPGNTHQDKRTHSSRAIVEGSWRMPRRNLRCLYCQSRESQERVRTALQEGQAPKVPLHRPKAQKMEFRKNSGVEDELDSRNGGIYRGYWDQLADPTTRIRLLLT